MNIRKTVYILIILMIYLISISSLNAQNIITGRLIPLGNGWGMVNITVNNRIELYDYDNDKFPELIIPPNIVLDGVVTAKGLYENLGDLIRINSYLISYSSNGIKVFLGRQLILQESGNGKLHVNLDKTVAIYNGVMVYNNGISKVSTPRVDYVFTLYQGKPIYAYQESRSHKLHVMFGGNDMELGVEITPLAMAISSGCLYIIGANYEEDDMLLVKIDGITSKNYQTVGIGLPRSSTPIAFDYSKNSFLIYHNGIIYLAGDKGVTILFSGKPLCADKEELYVAMSNAIRIYNTLTGTFVDSYPLPHFNLSQASCMDGILALANKSSIAVFYPAKQPTLSIYAERTGYVYEPIRYRVDYRNADRVIVLVNNTLKPLSGKLVFNRSGTYNITVMASNMFYHKTLNAEVTVLPRPIRIDVIPYNDSVKAHKNMIILIKSYDLLNMSKIHVLCNIKTPNTRILRVESWRNVTIPVDSITNSRLYTIQISCGDNIKFQKENFTYILPIKPIPVKLETRYKDNNLVEFIVADDKGNVIPGIIKVEYGNTTFSGYNPMLVTISKSNVNTTAYLSFTPSSSYYSALKVKLYIDIGSNSNNIEKSLTETESYRILIKRVVNNVTYTVTSKVPIFVGEKQHESTNALSSGIAVASISVALILGYLANRYRSKCQF